MTSSLRAFKLLGLLRVRCKCPLPPILRLNYSCSRQLNLRAAVHDDGEACALGQLCGGFINHAELRPENFDLDGYGFFRNLIKRFRAAKDLNHIYRLVDGG